MYGYLFDTWWNLNYIYNVYYIVYIVYIYTVCVYIYILYIYIYTLYIYISRCTYTIISSPPPSVLNHRAHRSSVQGQWGDPEESWGFDHRSKDRAGGRHGLVWFSIHTRTVIYCNGLLFIIIIIIIITYIYIYILYYIYIILDIYLYIDRYWSSHIDVYIMV